MKQRLNSNLITFAVVAILAVAVGLVLGRPDAGRSFSRALATAVESGQTPVKLGSLPSPDWERVFLFGPYTSSAQISTALGFTYSGPDTESSDGQTLLVFVSGRKVVFTAQHPRKQGDFAPAALGKPFAREAAEFSVSSQNGWRLLTPVPDLGDNGPPSV